MWLHNAFSGTASHLKKLSCLFPSLVPLVPKERKQFYFNTGHSCDTDYSIALQRAVVFTKPREQQIPVFVERLKKEAV